MHVVFVSFCIFHGYTDTEYMKLDDFGPYVVFMASCFR